MVSGLGRVLKKSGNLENGSNIMTDMDDLQHKVDQLTASYIKRLPVYMVTLKTIAKRLLTEPDPTVVLELREITHKLSGSAGSYGFADLGGVAKDLEGICISSLEDGGDLDDGINNISMALITLISTIDHIIKSQSSGD